jgi:hypothetical protein
MHVAAGRGVRRIDIGVSVNPDQANLLLLDPALLAKKLRHAGYRTGGN